MENNTSEKISVEITRGEDTTKYIISGAYPEYSFLQDELSILIKKVIKIRDIKNHGK